MLPLPQEMGAACPDVKSLANLREMRPHGLRGPFGICQRLARKDVLIALVESQVLPACRALHLLAVWGLTSEVQGGLRGAARGLPAHEPGSRLLMIPCGGSMRSLCKVYHALHEQW